MTLQFKNLGSLPAQQGFKENIGVTNFICGEVYGKFIVGGGSNFPYESNLNGGPKVQHKDLYLFEEQDDKLIILDQITTEFPLGEGVNVKIGKKLYYLQGEDIFEIYEQNNKIVFQEYAKLPFAIYNCFAQSKDNYIYFGLGNINGQLNKLVYSFNIVTKKLEKLTEFPSDARNQVVSALYDDELFIFSGGSAVAYTDGFKYSFLKDKWIQISSILVDNKTISLLGAGHTLNKDELLVVGGFNKEVWDEANKNFATLTGDDKKAFRERYLTMKIEDYSWNKQLLSYNFKEDKWQSLGVVSFDAPCGNSLLISNNSLYSLMGEKRPGIRSNNIYKIELTKL